MPLLFIYGINRFCHDAAQRLTLKEDCFSHFYQELSLAGMSCLQTGNVTVHNLVSLARCQRFVILT